ncbi:MAG: hypothetical protein RXR10_08380 [Vulcanisaeta sp.]
MSTKYFREARIDMVNEILNLEIPITTLNKQARGRDPRLINSLNNKLGIRYCIKHLSSTK